MYYNNYNLLVQIVLALYENVNFNFFFKFLYKEEISVLQYFVF